MFCRVRRGRSAAWVSDHERHLHHRKLPLAKRPGRRTLSPLRPRSADHRLPLPPAAAADRRGPPLRQPRADLALRRSLQVAGDALGRRGGTLLHRRRHGLGEVREVGRGRAQDAPQSALSLDPPGTQAAVRDQRPLAQSPDRAGNLGAVQRDARPRRHVVPRHHAADEGRAGLHDRRSGRFAGIPRGDRGRPGFQDPRAADLPARPGPGDRRAGDLQSLCRPSGRGEPASISATPFPASSRPCGSGTISSTRPAAGFPTMGWRPSTPSEGTALEATGIFARVRRGNRPSPEEVARFRSAMLHEMALWDHERGWTQQFHLGACETTTRGCSISSGPTRASIRLPTALTPGGCRGSSIGSTARTSWRRRSSTISIRRTMKSWAR